MTNFDLSAAFAVPARSPLEQYDHALHLFGVVGWNAQTEEPVDLEPGYDGFHESRVCTTEIRLDEQLHLALSAVFASLPDVEAFNVRPTHVIRSTQQNGFESKYTYQVLWVFQREITPEQTYLHQEGFWTLLRALRYHGHHFPLGRATAVELPGGLVDAVLVKVREPQTFAQLCVDVNPAFLDEVMRRETPVKGEVRYPDHPAVKVVKDVIGVASADDFKVDGLYRLIGYRCAERGLPESSASHHAMLIAHTLRQMFPTWAAAGNVKIRTHVLPGLDEGYARYRSLSLCVPHAAKVA